MQDPTDLRNAQREKPSLVPALMGRLDLFSMTLVVLAILLGFIGGALVAPWLGFLIASGQLLIVGILAGWS